MRFLAVVLFLLRAPAALALTAHLLAAEGGPLEDHAPGEDLRIGTADDPIVSHPSGVGPSDSGPNTHGTASFVLLNGFGGAPYPTWTSGTLYGFDYVLFVDGALQFVPDWSASTVADVVLQITGCGLRSTAEFGYEGGAPGSRGEATTTGCTGVAHFDPITGEASVVLSGTFAAPFDSIALLDQTMTAAPGKAKVFLRPQDGSTGDAYVDGILAPLLPDTTTALIVVEFTGRTNEATHQDWASRGVLAAYTTDDLGCAGLPMLPCGTTTTTTLACATFETCEPVLLATLPDVRSATGAARKVARVLRKLERKAARTFVKAESAPSLRRIRLHTKIRSTLQRLVTTAQRAADRARLSVPLEPLQAAATRLLDVLP